MSRLAEDVAGELFRLAFAKLAQVGDPAAHAKLLRAVISHVRSANPEQLACLSLWEPTEDVPTSAPEGSAA